MFMQPAQGPIPNPQGLYTTAFSNPSFPTESRKRERDNNEGLPEAKKHHTESQFAYCPICHRRFAGTKNRNRHIGIDKCRKDAKRNRFLIPPDVESLQNSDRHEELKDSCERLWGVARERSQTPATHPVTGGIPAPGVVALSNGSLPHLQSPYPNHATLTAGRNGMHSHLPQMPPIPASQPWPPYAAASQAHAIPISQGGAPGLRRFNSEPAAWASTGNVNWGQLPQRPSPSAQMARYPAPAVPGIYSSPRLQSATPNLQPNPVGLPQSSSCVQPQRMAHGPTRLQQSALFSGHGAFQQSAFSPMQPVQTGGANHGGAPPTNWQLYQSHLQRLPYPSQAGRMPLQSVGRPDHLSVPPTSAPYSPNTQVPSASSEGSHVTAASARGNAVLSEHFSSSATPSRSSTPAYAPNQTSDPRAHFEACQKQYLCNESPQIQHSSSEGAAAVLGVHPAPSLSTPSESSVLTSPAVEAAVNLDTEDFSWNVYTPSPRGGLVRLSSSQSVFSSQSPSGAAQDEGQHEAPQSLQVAGSTPDATGTSWIACSQNSDILAETLVDPVSTEEAPIEVPTDLDSVLCPLASGSQSPPGHGGSAEPGQPFNFAQTFHKLAAELQKFLDSLADINLVVESVLTGQHNPPPDSLPDEFWESLRSLLFEEPAPRQNGASDEKQLGSNDAQGL